MLSEKARLRLILLVRLRLDICAPNHPKHLLVGIDQNRQQCFLAW